MNSSELFNNFASLSIYSIATIIILSAVYCFFVEPYLSILFYTKQGGLKNFSLYPAFNRKLKKNVIKHGDSFHQFIEQKNSNRTIEFFVERVGSRPLIILNNIHLIKEFIKHPEWFKKADFLQGLSKNLDSTSILFQEGSKWKQARKVMIPYFHPESLDEAIPIIVDSTMEMFAEWRKRKTLNFDAMKMFSPISAEVIMRYLFKTSHYKYKSVGGRTFTAALTELDILMRKINQSKTRSLFGSWFVELGVLPDNKRYLDLKKECREMAEELVKRSVQGSSGNNNIIDQLQRSKYDSETPYNDARIIDEFIHLIEAGTDTVAHSIAFTLYYLSKNPAVLRKVKDEVDDVLTDLTKLNFKILHDMAYTSAVVKESLRLCPPSPLLFIREALDPINLEGVDIRKEDFVTVLTQTLHMSETYYSQPEDFIPERWLAHGTFPNDGWKKEPFAFIPFSEGPRSCVGQHFALIEVKLMLALLLKVFTFDVDTNFELKKSWRGLYEPLEPFNIRLEPKTAQ